VAGMVACVFDQSAEIVRQKIDLNLIKALEKVGRKLIPKDYLNIKLGNFEIKALRIFRITILIECQNFI
jgi:hypothetical protein